MKSGVVVFNRAEFSFCPDFRRKLLAYFPHNRLFRAFSIFNLSARKLPPVLPFSVATLRRKNQLFAASHSTENYRRRNVDLLERCSLGFTIVFCYICVVHFFSPFFVKSIIAVFSHFVGACYKVVEKLVRNTAMKREFHCDWLVAFRAARKS